MSQWVIEEWRKRMEVDAPNRWRTETPGHAGWQRGVRPGDAKKYFMVSCDSHVNEPHDLFASRLDAKYRDRIYRTVVDENGVQWAVSEGMRKVRLREYLFEGEDKLRRNAGADLPQRLQDMARDGIDIEVLFPNKSMSMWSAQDPELVMAQCRVYNDWVWQTYKPYNDRMVPMAAIG